MKKYAYFCGCCGARFTSDLPERNRLGLLNDIFCPSCGTWEIYTDDEKGHAEEYQNFNEYEDKLRLWDHEA